MRTVLVVTTLALAAQLLAGGTLILTLGNPEASPEAKSMNAVLTARVDGCARPADVRLTAAAIGTVNGQRRTIPLQLAPLRDPGFYALTRQWPAEGKWVIQLIADWSGRQTTTLVPAGPDGVHRMKAKQVHNSEAAQAEIDKLL